MARSPINGDIRTGPHDDPRRSVSASLHQRADFLTPSRKQEFAYKLRGEGWSYRRIAQVLDVPYRLVAQWLGVNGDAARPREPMPDVRQLLQRRAVAAAARAGANGNGNGHGKARARPASRAAIEEDSLQTVLDRLDALSQRVEDLAAALAADRDTLKQELEDRRRRDERLLERLEAIAQRLGNTPDAG